MSPAGAGPPPAVKPMSHSRPRLCDRIFTAEGGRATSQRGPEATRTRGNTDLRQHGTEAMPDPANPGPRRPFQFSLATLLLVMALFSVLAAALGGMLRGHWGTSTMPPGFFELMAAAAPVAVVVVLSLLHSLRLWLKRRRR